jgi:hypothetical protein
MKFEIKFFGVCALILSSLSIQAQTLVDFEPIPCTFNSSGEVTNTRGHESSEPYSVCDVPAEEIKLKVFIMGLCRTRPIFSDVSVPNLSDCEILYDNPDGYDVAVTSSGGLSLPNLNRPANGSYGYFLFVHSNTLSIKTAAKFNRNMTAENTNTTGRTCWTTESFIRCGASVDQTYAPNEIEIQIPNSQYQGSTERTALGSAVAEYFSDSDLKLQLNTATRWINVYLPVSNLVINDLTAGLKMSINVSSGAGVWFKRNNGAILNPTSILEDITDAPLAYVIDVVN